MDLVAADINYHHSWETKATSSLIHHRRECCDNARSWLLCMSKSFEFSNTNTQKIIAPTWLNSFYKWGPSKWPIPWCEVVKNKTIDCGVFAAFAKEIFEFSGFEAYSGQVIQHYSQQSLYQIKQNWEAAGYKPKWLTDSCVYHEVCAIRISHDEVKIYDPTDALWLDPDKNSGNGAVLSLRLELPMSMRWGQHSLAQDQWLDLI